MTTDDELHQAMMEKMLALDAALNRAEAGSATPEDWVWIRFECGIPKIPSLTTTEEMKNESNSV